MASADDGVEGIGPVWDAAHLDDFRAPEIGGEGELAHDMIAADAPEPDAEPVAETMSKDAFWTVFQAGFAIPGGIMPDLAPLAVQEPEKAAARASSDAIHDLLSIYYPKALMPMGETFALLLTAAPFLFAKVQIVRAVLEDRRKRRLEAARDARSLPGGPQRPQSSAPAPAQDKPDRPENSPLAWMDVEGSA